MEPKNIKECDKSKGHISGKLYSIYIQVYIYIYVYLLIMVDTLLLRP
jgi:hypothetical protein